MQFLFWGDYDVKWQLQNYVYVDFLLNGEKLINVRENLMLIKDIHCIIIVLFMIVMCKTVF